MKNLRKWFCVFFCLAGAASACTASAAPSSAAAYLQLLALFPEAAQGRGPDRGAPSEAPADQPMTYGLVLSAEALRHRAHPGEESARRVRLAARWLLEQKDLDGDGNPGWGLPQAWHERPKNTPYTITTAVALEGLLDALALPGFWAEEERAELWALVRSVLAYWCNALWLEGYGGGYFAYSPPDKAKEAFIINAPAMLLGCLSRVCQEHGAGLSAAERELFGARRDALARATVAQAVLREGAPFWKYTAVPNQVRSDRANDLIHQVYILWGLEVYRDAGGQVPWSRAAAIDSLERFWKGDQLCFYPYDEQIVEVRNRGEPANLWGAGMFLAFLGHWGSPEAALRVQTAIFRDYGAFPHLRVLPVASKGDAAFYPRDAAHVLFGMSHLLFR